MTIPNVVMHSGQQMYFFDRLIEDETGLMAKFSCMYCGGGDFILARVQHTTRVSLEAPPNGPPDEEGIATAVPEPTFAPLVLIALMIVFCANWWRKKPSQ